jgi:hypothetical protein
VCVDKFAGDKSGQSSCSFIGLEGNEILGYDVAFETFGQRVKLLNTDDSRVEPLKRDIDVKLIHLAFDPA